MGRRYCRWIGRWSWLAAVVSSFERMRIGANAGRIVVGCARDRSRTERFQIDGDFSQPPALTKFFFCLFGFALRDQQSTRIELKISHDELSEMVGTTRPRISLFMQRFRNLGLIDTNLDRFLVINEKNSPII